MSKRIATHSSSSTGPSVRPVPSRRRPYPAYPVSARTPVDESAALTPDQIPSLDAEDRALPSDAEAAEALGVGQHELSDEIREEERQRNPGAEADVERAGLAALAEEFDRRVAGGSR